MVRIFVRIIMLILTLIAVFRSPNAAVGAFYLFGGALFQIVISLRTDQDRLKALERDIRTVFSGTNSWITMLDVVNAVSDLRAREELKHGKYPGQTTRERMHRILSGIGNIRLMIVITQLLQSGFIEEQPDVQDPAKNLYRRLPFSRTRGPWGKRAEG